MKLWLLCLRVRWLLCVLTFFLLILLLHLQKIIGHVGFDSSASCGYPLFIISMAKCLFLFCLFAFAFIIHHTIFLSFGPLFFSLQYLLLLQCAGGDFLSLFPLCYLIYVYASISSLSVKTAGFWIWKRASKFRALTFSFSCSP